MALGTGHNKNSLIGLSMKSCGSARVFERTCAACGVLGLSLVASVNLLAYVVEIIKLHMGS
jgi:hypothetical protein